MSELVPNVYDSHRIVITWTVGDEIVVDKGDLTDWEVVAALERAMHLTEDEMEDAGSDLSA